MGPGLGTSRAPRPQLGIVPRIGVRLTLQHDRTAVRRCDPGPNTYGARLPESDGVVALDDWHCALRESQVARDGRDRLASNLTQRKIAIA